MTHHTKSDDKDYDLISLLYHSLQGAWSCSQYIQDAEQNGDKEALECFRHCHGEFQKMADQTKELLSKRL